MKCIFFFESMFDYKYPSSIVYHLVVAGNCPNSLSGKRHGTPSKVTNSTYKTNIKTHTQLKSILF